MSETKNFDGSRRHVLDWVESPDFLDTVRSWVKVQRWTISENPEWMPKSWTEPDESKLFDKPGPFLTDAQQTELLDWWLFHKGSANVPNWDLVIKASSKGKPALMLVEAKAHVDEFDCKAKTVSKRDSADAQARTDANHARIGEAIQEAALALAAYHPDISISRDKCYQLSNRIAMAWKLASMGIPVTLVLMGFTGDCEIARKGRFFSDDIHWQTSLRDYASASFPVKLFDLDIPCGAETFRVISRSLPVTQLSRTLDERRRR